jgi:hypothetical protein
MYELATLRFDKIGRFSLNNTIISFPDVSNTPFNNSREYYLAVIKKMLYDCELEKILCSTYQPPLPEWDTAAEHEKLELALWIYMQVGKFLGAQACNGPFPFEHGDWNDQNLLVNEEYCIVGVIDWETARTCPLESLKPSRLFQYTLKVISTETTDYYSGRRECLQTILGSAGAINLRIQELAQLFERPRFPQQFVTQVEQLIRYLHSNFEREMKQIIPLKIWLRLTSIPLSLATSLYNVENRGSGSHTTIE